MKSKIIEAENMPKIDGLSFRSFAGEADYPRMKAIIDAEAIADRDDQATTVEDIRHDYAHLINSDPEHDMIFAEVHGQTVAYSRVEWYQEETPNNRIYALFVKIVPEWRGQHIEDSMLAWCEARLKDISKGHPNDSERFFQTYSLEQKHPLNTFLETRGYLQTRFFFEMSRPLEALPKAALPEGVEVRPVIPEDIRQIWEANNEAFRDHWGYVEQKEEDYRWWRESKTCQPDLWQVGWAGEEIVGSVLNFIDHDYNTKFNRKRGWTEEITTHRDWRRKGIARALIARSMQVHKDQGMTEVALGVDTENPTGALTLYESLGYAKEKTMITYRKPF